MIQQYKTNIAERFNSILIECCDDSFVKNINKFLDFEKTEALVVSDLEAFAQKDPAARNETNNILFGYTSFTAVLHYRLASEILKTSLPDELDKIKYQYALFISSKGKLQSGAEIHPAAQIGERFILDHGFGTVIGETAEIGHDCYVLGGVILGAIGIASNIQVKRHPKIGNNVQIGSFSRIFGTVSIGNNVFIGANLQLQRIFQTILELH